MQSKQASFGKDLKERSSAFSPLRSENMRSRSYFAAASVLIASLTSQMLAVAADQAGNKSSDAPAAASGLHFSAVTFNQGKIITSKVWLIDTDKAFRKPVVEVKADAGGLTQKQRVTKIAERLTNKFNADPQFYKTLFQDIQNSEYVVRPDLNTPNNWIVTADRPSAKLNHLDARNYALTLKETIQGVLIAANFRDAPFDYQLRTAEQKRERAELYRNLADDEFANAAPDYKRSEELYEHALVLLPNDPAIRLRLALTYDADGQPDKARSAFDGLSRTALDPTEYVEYDTLKQKLG